MRCNHGRDCPHCNAKEQSLHGTTRKRQPEQELTAAKARIEQLEGENKQMRKIVELVASSDCGMTEGPMRGGRRYIGWLNPTKDVSFIAMEARQIVDGWANPFALKEKP